MKKRAFTLAETLITLVIVGIVAALTVPNMIVQYKKEETVDKLKKAYSTLNNAVKKSTIINGPVSGWEVPNMTTIDDVYYREYFKQYFAPYLNIAKSCYYLESKHASECWNENGAKYTYCQWYKSLSNQNAYYLCNSFILNDGTGIGITTAGQFIIDVNGRQKPNVLGKDTFLLNLNKNKGVFEFPFYNFWGRDTRNKLFTPEMFAAYGSNNPVCAKYSSRYSGEACGALIMLDGWKISDDYPW